MSKTLRRCYFEAMSHSTHTLLLCMLLIVGCSTPQPASEQLTVETAGETTRNWQLGHFQVRFAAGPVKPRSEGGQKGFSSYSLLYQGDLTLTEVADSAIDIEWLIDSSSTKLTDYIAVWASPSEKWLLIKEDVPSDCGPCANFVLIERLEEVLKVSYLKMPMWQPPVKPLPGGTMPLVWSEYPMILQITDEEIEYQFSNKKLQRIKIRDVPRKDGVTFPG